MVPRRASYFVRVRPGRKRLHKPEKELHRSQGWEFWEYFLGLRAGVGERTRCYGHTVGAGTVRVHSVHGLLSLMGAKWRNHSMAQLTCLNLARGIDLYCLYSYQSKNCAVLLGCFSRKPVEGVQPGLGFRSHGASSLEAF